MKFQQVLHVVIFLLNSSCAVEADDLSSSDHDDIQTCGLWLAPSSIPNSGLGMYAGKDYEPGRVVEIVSWISLVDYNEHNAEFGDYSEEALMEDYYWNPSGPMEFEGYSSFNLCTNVGALANSQPYHNNIDQLTEFRMHYTDNILDRTKDPGVGAFTYYSSDAKIIKHVVAGEELFLDYGDEWRFYREAENIAVFPTFDDHKRFETILNDMCNYFSKDFQEFDGDKFIDHFVSMLSTFYRESSEVVSQEVFDNSYIIGTERSENLDPTTIDFFKEHVIFLQEKLAKTKSAEIFLSTLNNLFEGDKLVKFFIPRTLDEMKSVCERGITSTSIPNRIRNIEWLKSHGQCLDNIEKKRSTIRQAGFGAFATRFIAAGTVIAPAPLFHINDRRYFDLRENTVGTDKIGKQLMLNYCFGHERSSMLFCMMSTAAMINHKRTNLSNGDAPNASYRWSTWDETHKWLDLSIDDLKSRDYRGLSLDIVALRDIQPGEEVFIDYGVGWEEAWHRHLASWKPLQSSVYLTEFIESYNGPFRTEPELTINPYPPNISTACYFWANSTAEAMRGNVDFINPHLPADDQRAIKSYGFRGDYLSPGTPHKGENRAEYPCKVMDREHKNPNRYTVQIFMRPNIDIDEWISERDDHRNPYIVSEFPGQFINFVHRPYTSDQHLKSAFRHHIVFNDELFPEHWKDL